MKNVLSPEGGLLFLFLYGATMIALTFWITKGRRQDKVEFLVANRGIGVLQGAMSIAASWIWAPALFLASQKAYEQGIAGLFWFTVPNLLALVLFAPLALKIRRTLPHGYTLPQFIRRTHGPGVHILYLIQFFSLQICSFAVQILAGSVLIQAMTGLDFHIVATVLVIIALSYSVMGGIRASIMTDFLQMALILGISALVVPWVLLKAGGISTVVAGLGGYTGEFRNIFDPWVAYSFGIPVTIALLSGPIGDQMHWQRAYSLRSDGKVIKTFMLGAFLFVIVPLTLSLLGFVAADPQVSSNWNISNNQLIGPITVSNLLPGFMMVIFSVMLLSGLCSTLDSILCAVSSLVSVDLFRNAAIEVGIDEHDLRKVVIARVSMLVAAGLGLGIAFFPGIQIIHLFLFYGTLRASTMIPTVLSLFWKKLNSKAVFAAILSSLILGAPVYALGTLLKNPHLSVAGSLLVLFIGFSTCIFGSMLSTKPNQTISSTPKS